MMTITKCNEKNICENLKTRLVNKGRGFYLKEAAGQLLGVAYKKTKKDKGLMVNYCPWCGGTAGAFAKYV